MRGTITAALVVAIIALILGIWAVWDISTLRERVDGISTQVAGIEAAPQVQPTMIEALEADIAALGQQVQMLEARLDELEAAPPPAPEPEPTPAEPPPVVEGAPEAPEDIAPAPQ